MKFNIPQDHRLISFDAVSLFTNIDSYLVLKIINQRWDSIQSASGAKLSKNAFIEALQLV